MNQRQILILENGKGHFCHFLTNPIVKKSKADTKVKKPYDRNDTRKIKNEWFKQFEWLQLDNGPASDCSTKCTSKSCESDEKLLKCRVNKYFTIKCIFFLFIILLLCFVTLIKLLYCK